MTESPPTKQRSLRRLRHFGITMAVVLSIIGGILLWRDRAPWPYLFAAAGLFLISCLLFPRLLAPVERTWMKMAHYLGIVTTHILLVITYYLVITPVGTLRRLFCGDSFNLKMDRQAESYWIKVDPEGSSERPDKPY